MPTIHNANDCCLYYQTVKKETLEENMHREYNYDWVRSQKGETDRERSLGTDGSLRGLCVRTRSHEVASSRPMYSKRFSPILTGDFRRTSDNRRPLWTHTASLSRSSHDHPFLPTRSIRRMSSMPILKVIHLPDARRDMGTHTYERDMICYRSFLLACN
jgi:hypothetical protein